MQSIYFFRDADTELFGRVQTNGLEIPQEQPLLFDSVALSANFRTARPLLDRLNEIFALVFAADDGSGVTFYPAEPARDGETNPAQPNPGPQFNLHLAFAPQISRNGAAHPDLSDEEDGAPERQTKEIVELIRSHMEQIERCRIERHQGSEKKYRIAVLGRTRSALAPIAAALRGAAIPFRAVDLEKLAARPEVLDTLSLARALLNPMDRVAWLGVLRAPWCGLTLEGLHRLTSADDPTLLARPIPELLAERLALLDAADCQAAQRVLHALAPVPALRATQPTASLGTWLEQIWLRLGGAACGDANARANLDLLWSCLDRLPGGEQDLLGPTLDAALDKLTAQPDPAASSECGVQLMTIHKSKGLEFEVVIVPDLQAGARPIEHKMLSWLERGLATPDDSGQITEFLIAPFQAKGADREMSKAWVDRVYRQRETQEMRRILYVAATRAREELHLFARPAYRVESTGGLSLPNPANCLLATAWPALEEEIRSRFEESKTILPRPAVPDEEVIESIAAAAHNNLLVMPSPVRPTPLRRLPPDYQPGAPSFLRPFAERMGDLEPQSTDAPSTLYSRHEGNTPSRAVGAAVHALLEELARLRATQDWPAARTALRQFQPRITAQIRATGLDQPQAVNLAAQALRHALAASEDPAGQWILSPHPDAASEVAWAGIVSGTLRTVRVDRVFRAGSNPLTEGQDCWWIVDYKTAHAGNIDPAAALPGLRRLFAPQVEAYAQILRNLHGRATPIHAGLYYPRMLQLDWWEL